MSAWQPMILAFAAIIAGAIEFALLLRLLRKYIDPMEDTLDAFFSRASLEDAWRVQSHTLTALFLFVLASALIYLPRRT
ncbi:MAG: hypothetical protein IPK23_14960 [Rhizobiales bacterium]|nr:hypothetical protein [Hyphomicrobiales bacterium]